MLPRNARRALLTIFLLLPLLVSGAAVAQATPEGDRPNTETSEVGVLGACDWSGCGTVVNATGRGFHVTINWGAPWNEDNVKWVKPWSTYGLPQWVDVDGFYVAPGCFMSGTIVGRPPLPIYNVPFAVGPGWYKIWTNETANIAVHACW
jgi:hypothetical protein